MKPDISRVKRPKDWPFSLSEESEWAINELLEGLDHGSDLYYDLWLEDCHAAFRSQTEEEERQLYAYYVAGGWGYDAMEQ